MRFKNVFKESLISLAVLGMIGGSINANNVNASRRRYRIHRVYHHRARKVNYKFGYWKHHHYYRYKTGYFRNGKWIRKSYRHSAHRISHRSHKVYRFMGRTYHSERDYDIALYNSAVFGNPDGIVKHHRNHRIKRNKHSNKKLIRHTHAKSAQHNKVTKQSTDDSFDPDNPTIVKRNLAEMKQQTLNDINNDRQANGVSPLIESNELDNIANMRAKQIYTNYEHTDPNRGIDYDKEEAAKLGYSNVLNESLGENIDNNLTSYSNKEDGTYLANTAENNMVNHDAHSNWGHRRNILTPEDNHVGIGVAYNGDGSYSLAENFEY